MAGIQCGETLERIVEIGYDLELLVGHRFVVLEVHRSRAASAFRGKTGSCSIDEQIAHDLRGEREKVGAVSQLDATGVDESQVRLVNQLSRIERILEWRAPEPAARELAQPVVYEWNELSTGVAVPCAPTAQEQGNVGNLGRGRIHPFASGRLGRPRYPFDPSAASSVSRFDTRFRFQEWKEESPFNSRRVAMSTIQHRALVVFVSTAILMVGGCHRSQSTAPKPSVAESSPRRFPGVDIVPAARSGFLVRIHSGMMVGNGEPLYVIDGAPMRIESNRGIDWFTPEAIADIKVLKAPHELAEYGPSGANGVIVITTNRSPGHKR